MLLRYSRNRSGAHPVEHLRGFMGLLQADAYAGFNPLYAPSRVPGPVTASFCWTHGRRKFYELPDIAAGKRRGKGVAAISPVALEAVKRIDALFDIEREINGESAERRLAVRRGRCAPLVAEPEAWMGAERTLRPLAVGRKSWLFAGSDRGGERAAAMYTLIGTAKLNDVDPQAWLADVLGRIAALPHTRVHELLPWNWKAVRDQTPVA